MNTPDKTPAKSETLSEHGMKRRNFIIAGAAAGGGLLIGFALPKMFEDKGGHSTPANSEEARDAFSPNAFIRIDKEGVVTLVMSKVEMGQGTFTSITMLIAEELGVDPAQVKLAQAPADEKKYADPLLGGQVTGGSTSIRGAWEPMRKAGAVARTMLVSAACQEWNVDAKECRVENGYVLHSGSDKKIGYGELVEKAATLPVPQEVTLKEAKEFTLIGKPIKRLDSPQKVNGQAVYGIDVRQPNMKIATVAMSPVLGGKVVSVDDSKARNIKGVRKIVKLDDAVAVIADHMWAAKQGLAALDIKWDGGRNETLMMKDIIGQLDQASSDKGRAAPGAVATSEGDFKAAFAKADEKSEAVYQLPFLSHAAIEPMNATVHVQKDRCDVWVGTQVPAMAQAGAVGITKLPPEKVFIHNHHIGGGFGRRLDVDFINQAVAIAKTVDYPVKLVWTREEDMQHGIYRPYYYDRLSAGLDKDGNITAWKHQVTGSSIMARWIPQFFKNGLDSDAVEVAREPLYAPANIFVEYIRQEPPGMVTGWWRGVGATHNTFMVESFIDELAHKVGKDPLQYRLANMKNSPRAQHVLEVAAKAAGWGQPLPKGSGRGLSVQYAFGTYVAQVAELEVKEDEVHIKRVVCVVDCGMVVNPDHVKAQMEGGINFGISGALWGEITINNGKVAQSNFDNYRVMRMRESPVIEVHLVQSSEAPGGIGEPGTAAIAPALTNAIFAATGKRIRNLPIKNSLTAA
ncbi:xanthine dehydrogenase family protein molybdopterin-binding subunit [Methylophilus sp.]|uniref:xanthine dehydrogenase family protein molybdopterin-binding subunit n=1 Tax=Methylophilus sp. TaxID=29541 RepID=UPI000D4CE573|nr:xanthine dehydrogenase family protein molybdopterin-binding subunit [Methylophilus sp.]PPD13431.1 MAG: aldehyde dehydrogenase [Methylophilus sp.]